MPKRRGRTRKPGERYPSGDLRRVLEPIAPAAWERIRKDIAKQANNPLLESELGRLSFHRELTSTQVAAGFRVAAIYAAFEQLERVSRSSRSASYESGLRGETGIPEEYMAATDLEALRTKEALIRQSYRDLHEKELVKYPKALRDCLEQLCADNRAVNPTMLPQIATVLDRLALYFGVTKSTKRATRMPAGAKPQPQKPARRDDLDREAFFAVLRKLRPDLDFDQLTEAHEFQRALKARAVTRRAKERKAANVVYLPGKEMAR